MKGNLIEERNDLLMERMYYGVMNGVKAFVSSQKMILIFNYHEGIYRTDSEIF